MKKLAGVQTLRGVAANMVVIFHCLGIGLLPKYGFKSQFEPLTFLTNCRSGVDLLLCISGFVTCYSYLNTKNSGFNFFRARAIRIIPIYWIFTTVSFIILTLGSFQTEYKLFFQSLLFVVDPNFRLPILAVGWTLQYVMFFYLLFALVLAFCKHKRFLILSLLLMTTVILQPSRIIILEFIFGGIGYLLYNFNSFKKFKVVIFCSSFSLYLLSFFAIADSFAKNYRVVFFGIPAFLMVASFASIKLPKKSLQTTGSYSYSLYLIHFPLLSIYFKLMSSFDLKLFPVWLLIFGAVISCNAAAFITWKYIEAPLTKYLINRFINY